MLTTSVDPDQIVTNHARENSVKGKDMSEKRSGTFSATQNLFVDSLDSEIAESLKDPRYRAAFEDSAQRHGVIDELVELRKDRGLTQKQVAERMGVGQSTIAGFENEGSDPRLSTIQRYARAVEARLVVAIQANVECDWVKPSTKYKNADWTRKTAVAFKDPSASALTWAQASLILAA